MKKELTVKPWLLAVVLGLLGYFFSQWLFQYFRDEPVQPVYSSDYRLECDDTGCYIVR